jgi:uncharacterized protein (DUF1330 family)
MAKGYWVSVYPAISDPERLTAYNKLARLAVQAGGGRTLSRGGRVVAHEAGNTQRVVLIEFDSFEQAVAAYESEAYQKARRSAWSASLFEHVSVSLSGVPHQRR